MSKKDIKNNYLKLYGVTIDTQKIEERLQKLRSESLKQVCKTFQKNLDALESSVMLPLSLVYQGVARTDWIERFRRAMMQLAPEGRTDNNEAIKRIMEELDNGDQLDSALDILDELVKEEEDIKEGIQNLLNISVVNLWTVFEVLSSDLWLAAVNSCPQTLGRSVYFAKKDRISKIIIERLSDSNFSINLEHEIGTVSLPFFDFSGVYGIKEAFDIAFGKNANTLTNRLVSQEEVKKLQAMRNLIVHKGGIVDEAYRRLTGENIEAGTQLLIRREDFLEPAKNVVQMGVELISFVDESLNRPFN